MNTGETMSQRRATRRAFLRGAGIALALPWLESLPARAEDTGKRATSPSAKPPVRFACIYFSNGVEPEQLRLEDGLSMLYGSNISWASATKPATKEIYPARVYDLLVGNGQSRQLDRSILDQLTDDANSLKRRISGGDREKLDEYLES